MQIPVGKTDIPIAIIGMACRVPGADNLDQYWRFLAAGGSAVAEVPPDRLDQELYYDPRKGQRGKTYCKLAALVSSRKFDSQECPIPKSLEQGVDNSHLLMCQVTAAAFRHAGMDPFNLQLRNTGVYIGHAQGSDLSGEYIFGTYIEEAAQFLRDVPEFEQLGTDRETVIRELIDSVRARMPRRAPDSPDTSNNMVAGTISKAFGLNGPFLAINSACASSLQAVQLAVRALQLGRVDMAVAGGASDCKAGSLVLFAAAQSMSETGSRPFDANADGLICSEGYVALVLKTLPRALADGDPIQAIIPGLGCSSDGRGKSLWAPRKEGQVKAMERAYRNGLDMGTLQYIEMHATSTSLGDATELNTLNEVLAGKFAPGKKIPISSVKANIGHALEAAGISGLIKAVLCMQHRTFVPAINIESLNPKIDWEKAPFFPPRELMAWPAQPDGGPRRAAVNAFGIGGLNMHVVLEEFTEQRREELKARYLKPRVAPSANPDDDAVAVIGMGCILPGASDVNKYWELVTSGRDARVPAPAGRWRTDLAVKPGTKEPYRTGTSLGGYITEYAYDWKRHKVPPKQVEQADPLQFMLLDTSEQALVDAGYDKKQFDRDRVAVLVGAESSGDFGAQLAVSLRLPELEKTIKELLARRGHDADKAARIASGYGEAMLRHWPALVDESGSFSTSTLASRITKTMNFMGGAAAIDAGEASSAAALATGIDLLLSGDCDMIVCAGGQRSMSLAQFENMTQNGTLSLSDKPRSPFDAASDGVVPGEGTGVVVLRRLSDARRDGDPIRAIIRGVGAAHALAASESIPLAINRALKTAHVDPADVALIEIDGTGLPQRDQDQLQGILSVYGRSQRREPLLLGTVSGQIGHTFCTSTMALLIKAGLEVQNGQLPRAVGLATPLPEISNSQIIRAATEPLAIRHTTRDGRRLAAVSSFSKGQAFHILIERGEKVAPSPASAPSTPAKQLVASLAQNASPKTPAVAKASTSSHWQICRLGAATPEELARKLEQACKDPGAAFAAAGRVQYLPTDQARLAIVADSPSKLGEKLELTAKQWANPAALPALDQQGCFYRQLGANRPRVAFVFPGQGSQYAGMLRDLVRDVPQAADTMRQLDAIMARRGYQTFSQMAWENPAQLGSDIWVTQASMLLSNLIVHSAATALGIVPDVITSHSYGEYAALAAAGVWDLETVVTAARARYDGIEATATARGQMMATTAPPEVIESVAATLPDRAYIANYNAPDQTVVGGRVETLRSLAALLEAAGYPSPLIPVPCPFHTPLMQGSATLLQATLETLPLGPARIPFLSSVTNRYVADPAEVRVILAAQLTTPVRYVELIRRIAGERDTVLVEVGPQQALTKLNRRILAGRSVPGIIACDNPKRPGVEQLLHVRALLESVGAMATPAPGATSRDTHVAVPTAAAPKAPTAKGEILHFDATERRRDKMRQTATKRDAQTEATPHTPPTRPLASPSTAKDTNGSNGHPAPTSIAPSAAPVRRAAAPTAARPAATAPKAPSSPPPAATPPAPAPATSAAKSSGNLADLEKFLINFVVEQTGYPPEVVELDADLEADLGIDSIKKAQLFGELSEYFNVQPTENMTLDDFPTLRHVLNFLRDVPAKVDLGASAPQASATAPAPTPATTAAAPQSQVSEAVAPAARATATKAGPDAAELEKFLINFVVEQTGYPPEVVELDADLEADLGIDSIKKAQLFGELSEYFNVQPTENMTLDDFPTLRHVLNFLRDVPTKQDLGAGGAVESTPAAPAPAPVTASAPSPVAVAAAPQAAAAAAPKSGPDPAELEQFLINFVVEQTGYPPEVVELDADLEADLGIDSIKKAQLFGELSEYFSVQPTENMTLDDFPTLRHVLNFLRDVPTKQDLGGGGGAGEPAVPEPPKPSGAPRATMPTVAPQTELREEPIGAAMSATAVAEPPKVQSAVGRDRAELEQFLINFVVEQTGYPPEVVELDADLEADLGIDSIKKAQLFGELSEYFSVRPTENMTLDDFPTLRHVLDFLLANDTASADAVADDEELMPSVMAPVASTNGSAAAPTSETQTIATVERSRVAEPPLAVLRLRGTAYEMGLEHGRQCKTAIQRILRRFADLTDSDPSVVPIVHESAGGLERHFRAAELDELRGIAEGAQVPLENLLALNLAIDADLGTSSSHLALKGASGSQVGLLHGVRQELPLQSSLSGFLEPRLVVREPADGHAHAMLSFAGLVGGLCGVNAQGLGVTASALVDDRRSQRCSRVQASVASAILADAHDVDSAVAAAGALDQLAGWCACLSHASTNQTGYLESDGHSLHSRTGDERLRASNRSQQGAAPASAAGNGDAASLSENELANLDAQRLCVRLARQVQLTNGDGQHAVALFAAEPLAGLAFAVDARARQLCIAPFSAAPGRSHSATSFDLSQLLPAPRPPLASAATAASAPYDLDDDLEEETQRFVLRMIDAPLEASVPAMPSWTGAALVIGDNAAADALRRRLREGGVTVRDLPIVDDLDAMLSAFDKLWAEQPLPYLFLMSGRDAVADDLLDPGVWRRRMYLMAELPFFLCQRWVQRAGDMKMLDRCALVGATSLNGDMGFSSNVRSPESAALAGLIKGIFIEVAIMRGNKTMMSKVIDAPADETPERLAECICRELASRQIDFEVAYVDGQRRLHTAEPQKAPVQTRADIRPGGTWVITGGARGITAECAMELGRRFGLKLHLIGTSPATSIDPVWRNLDEEGTKTLRAAVMRDARAAGRSMDEAWSRVQKDIEIDGSLRAFAAAGIDATYHSCDVVDADALAKVLEQIRQASGPIEGIVHGAGIERACKFEKKNREAVLATLGAKVEGAMNLMRLTQRDPVRHFIGFGSISGRLGSNGQTDYCLASDMLCKLVAWHRSRHPRMHATSFHWHPWDGVGMAVRPEAAGAMRMGDGPSQMPKVEGLRHFVRELYANAPESEVLITTWEYHGRYYGTGYRRKPASQGLAPESEEDGRATAAPTVAAESKWDPFPQPKLASRNVLVMANAPLSDGASPKVALNGPAWILGHNPTALALRDRMVAQGIEVVLLPDSAVVEEVAAAMDTAYKAQPPAALFLLGARDTAAGSLLSKHGWQQRRSLGVVMPFVATQHLFRLRRKAKQTTPLVLLAATALGGDFGISGNLSMPEGGALAGLLKSLYIEDTRKANRELVVKVIDAPAAESPEAVADAILRELASGDARVEVGWSAGQRRIVQSIEQPIESLAKQKLPRRGGTWVLTGGARGITAATAFALGKRFGVRLHLVGRSPVPREDAPWRNCTPEQLEDFRAQIVRRAVSEGRSPEQEWDALRADLEIYQTMRRFAAEGIEATYYECDLANWDRLGTVLDEIRRKDGPIEGIVHGAGWGKSGRFESRSREHFERAIHGKLDGAVALMALTANDPVRHWIGFGSISGRFGGNGLSDYAAGNDMLAKLIDWYRTTRPDCAACCFHWQSWDEVGMATRGDSAVGTKGVLKMDFISPGEGVEHLCREVEAGLPEREVLITDGYFERAFYSSPEAQSTAPPALEPVAELEHMPLVDSTRPAEQGQGLVAEIHFEPAVDPFLYDHKLRDKPLLPAVVGLESMAEATALFSGKPVAAFHNVEFIEGLRFHSDRRGTGRVRVAVDQAGQIAAELVSDFQNRSGKVMDRDRLHFRSLVEPGDRSALAVPMPTPPTTWHPVTFEHGGPMYHGPTLQGLRGVSLEKHEGWGQMIALPLRDFGGPNRGPNWLIPATLIDATFYLCAVHLFFCVEPYTGLPQSIERLRLGRMPRDGEQCLAQIVCRSVQPRSATYDCTVFGEDRATIFRIEGYECVMLKPGAPR